VRHRDADTPSAFGETGNKLLVHFALVFFPEKKPTKCILLPQHESDESCLFPGCTDAQLGARAVTRTQRNLGFVTWKREWKAPTTSLGTLSSRPGRGPGFGICSGAAERTRPGHAARCSSH
jgi:hypothetical protein